MVCNFFNVLLLLHVCVLYSFGTGTSLLQLPHCDERVACRVELWDEWWFLSHLFATNRDRCCHVHIFFYWSVIILAFFYHFSEVLFFFLSHTHARIHQSISHKLANGNSLTYVWSIHIRQQIIVIFFAFCWCCSILRVWTTEVRRHLNPVKDTVHDDRNCWAM